MAAKAISSPVPVDWYPTLAVVMVAVGLMFTASFFISAVHLDFYGFESCQLVASAKLVNLAYYGYGLMGCKHYEATSSRRNRSLAKEIVTATIASVFLGFGSLFVLLASGVYV
uniref:Dolichyl-diphosphooligosaccharide-protein glycosyltransferase subunit OST5 n=1 Tax=Oryza punctata TaxID=4537 RepID=A0A0E0LCS8_ORYPU